MSKFDLLQKQISQCDDSDEKVIDLSDNSHYPASVLADLNHIFALSDDNQNMICFLKDTWQQPSFHWGWNNITHEEAVKSDFLYRAFCNMNSQYRKRRDAMIAAEGYRFVWKNKEIEPVAGILSGEQLCDYMNRCLDEDLESMKFLNDYEDMIAQRAQNVASMWTLMNIAYEGIN